MVVYIQWLVHGGIQRTLQSGTTPKGQPFPFQSFPQAYAIPQLSVSLCPVLLPSLPPKWDPEGRPSQPAPYLPSGVCALGNQVREIHHQPPSLLGALRRPPTQRTVKGPLINMPACLLSPINHSLSDSFPTFANWLTHSGHLAWKGAWLDGFSLDLNHSCTKLPHLPTTDLLFIWIWFIFREIHLFKELIPYHY